MQYQTVFVVPLNSNHYLLLLPQKTFFLRDFQLSLKTNNATNLIENQFFQIGQTVSDFLNMSDKTSAFVSRKATKSQRFNYQHNN